MRLLAKLYFAIIGWKTENLLPPDLKKKYVMIGAPHTSNLDFPITIAALLIMRVKSRHLAKKELFKFPLGIIMRAFGGIPVVRDRNTRMVDAMIEEFKKHDELVLLVPPEGTRGFVKEWKSGFYYVALGAGVPIAIAYLDYGRKMAGIKAVFYPTGDFEEDLVTIKSYYQGVKARFPELSSLKE
jgi:1-acyl-sn-glycerol-3-phosphate acyltransferase